jgi:HSP20 family protein
MKKLSKTEKGVLPTVNSFFDEIFNWDEDFKKRFNRKVELPVVNISEEEDAYLIELAAPGLDRNDFKIEVEDNTLWISFEKEDVKEEHEKNYTSKEYSYGSFKRSFWLPENTKVDEILANFENGVLKVSIPTNEIAPKETRTIDIR